SVGAQLPNHQVGLYSIGYCWTAGSNLIPCNATYPLQFDHLDLNARVSLVYDLSNPRSPNYVYQVTNSPVSPGFVDATSLNPGRYRLWISANDIFTASQFLPLSPSSSVLAVKPSVLKVNTMGTGTGTVSVSPAPLLTCAAGGASNCY